MVGGGSGSCGFGFGGVLVLEEGEDAGVAANKKSRHEAGLKALQLMY